MERSRTCVLAGIDFSEGAMSALREARWLARRAGLELQVLHVTEHGPGWGPDAPAREWLDAASFDPAMVLVRQGRAWVEIVRHAHEVSAAVIVLGSHGASGFQAMSLGSTASRVALRAPCPVLFAARREPHLTSDETSAATLHPL